MLTEEDDVEINALWARGWSVSAISRHTGRDRKTVSKYVAGPRPVRAPAPSCLEPWRAYIAARFEDDPHLEATVLHRELVDAGFERAYTTLVGELRRLQLRPVCLTCAHRRGDTVTTEIDHPAGEEIQWDWLEFAAADTPWGEAAYVLVGALSHSGRFRGVFCEQMTFGHLAAAMHQVLVALGGTPRVWRTDRMATVVTPQTGRITPDAAALAKHYGTQIAVCPARRAQRKGVVEKAIQYLTRSWWRTAAVATLGEAQRSLDRWSIDVADTRDRPAGTVGQLGAGEPLQALPAAAYPAQIAVERKVSRAALAAFEGNHYSVPPVHAGRTVTVTWRVTEPLLRIVSMHGEIVAEHRRVQAGAGQTVRCAEHAALLETAVLAAFTTKHACRRKPNLPPGDSALAELARLRGLDPEGAKVISLADYAALAEAQGQAR
ncbi:MAG TPA: IS21 family transposase [Candidatus Polarisedimenticolaceae bacterium]|nr:IS21 family transposase [Candidatus Polarisedimenticolaceae bacterium]